MQIKEFTPIWKKFCAFYDAPSNNDVQLELYFEQYAYLPAKTIDYIFTQVMKQERGGFRSLPTIQQIEPHKNAAFAKSHKDKNASSGEPPLPGVIRQANATFLKLIIQTQTDKSKMGLDYVIENHAEYWAKLFLARMRIEIECECDMWWCLGWEKFLETAEGVDVAFRNDVEAWVIDLKQKQTA